MKHLLLTTIAAVVLVGCVSSRGPIPTKDEVANWPLIKINTYDRELTLKSVNGRNPVWMVFHNKSSNDVDMIWLNFDGKPESYGTLEAGVIRLQPTYATHAWLFKNANTGVIIGYCITPQYSAQLNVGAKTVRELKVEQPAQDTRQANLQAGPVLVDSVREGNLKAVKQHLAAGADVEIRNQQGFTPLHVAAQKGHNKVAELLIAKGANINTSGRLIGTTPLDSAALLGHKEMVELLIDSGADINPQIITGETPLQRAEQRGHSAIAEILRKHGGKAGEVTLQLAILKGQKDVAKSLITGGADVNAKGLLGRTPLDWAIIGGKNELADLLRKHGGKTGEELKGGKPVPKAATPEPPKGKAPDISIHDAAESGNIEAVKQHLAAGTDVNLGGGATPLHPATYSGHKEVVELLIGNGANVNAKSKGWTPLDIAIEFEHTEIADILRKNGAKTAMKN